MQLGNSIAYAGLFDHAGGMHSLALVSRAANAPYTVDFLAQNSYLPACGSIRRLQRDPELARMSACWIRTYNQFAR
jgi:hypothetical protein